MGKTKEVLPFLLWALSSGQYHQWGIKKGNTWWLYSNEKKSPESQSQTFVRSDFGGHLSVPHDPDGVSSENSHGLPLLRLKQGIFPGRQTIKGFIWTAYAPGWLCIKESGWQNSEDSVTITCSESVENWKDNKHGAVLFPHVVTV